MKPGKPTTFATIPHDAGDGIKNKPFLCLPGNPVSAVVSFYLFALPALKKMSCFQNPKLNWIQAEVQIFIV